MMPVNDGFSGSQGGVKNLPKKIQKEQKISSKHLFRWRRPAVPASAAAATPEPRPRIPSASASACGIYPIRLHIGPLLPSVDEEVELVRYKF